MDRAQGCVTFKDVFVNFSWEEWELLDYLQRLLYLRVMLENFALVATLGRWHEEDSEELHCVSVQGTPRTATADSGLPMPKSTPS